MTEPPPAPSADPPPPFRNQSTGTRDWVARRAAARSAAAADRARAEAERTEKFHDTTQGYENPRGVWIGLAVVAALLLLGLYLINAMRCDPFYSDRALTRNGGCR